MRLGRIRLQAIILLCAVLFPASVFALDLCYVPNGATYIINEHSTCKKVTNNHASGQEIMVPLKSAAEWDTGGNAFLNALPAGVSVADCSGGGGSSVLTPGYWTVCAIRNDNVAMCWGNNQGGQIGNGTTTSSNVPTAVNGGAVWKHISSGGHYYSAHRTYTCGLKTDDTAWCWGTNPSGNLGDGTTTQRLVPTAVSGGGTWASISAGGAGATCGIKSDGTAWCWGKNQYGTVGDGTTTQRNVPTAVSGGGVWEMISTGHGTPLFIQHNCGIKTGGSAWCWGYNSAGQLGDGTTTQRNVPTAVSGGATWQQISAGAGHTCGIKTDGTAWCWGGNSLGQLGDGTTNNRNIPTAVSGGGTWQYIFAGSTSTCGIKADGMAWCWGGNYNSAIGDGTNTQRNVPTAVSGGGTWVAIVTGGDGQGFGEHSCGIRTDGTAWCWGSGLYGVQGISSPITPDQPTPIAVEGGHTWLTGGGGGPASCTAF